jgi:hypothetical protein
MDTVCYSLSFILFSLVVLFLKFCIDCNANDIAMLNAIGPFVGSVLLFCTGAILSAIKWRP